jgi:hypothetical protein
MSMTTAFGHTTALILGLPFDLVRANYARAVSLGFVEQSLLKSARFERDLCAVERQTLGLWARRV